MGRSRAKGTSGGKAASASEAGGSLKRKAASASGAGGSLKKRKAASASGAGGSLKRKASSASEAGGSLKRKAASASEEREILRLKKEEDRKILSLKKEEDRKFRMVKKEEGKILKLKKDYTAAEEEAMAKLPAAYRPTSTVKVVEPVTGKKKKVMVKRLVPQEQIDALLALPSSIVPNRLTDEQLTEYSQTFRDIHNQEVNIMNKLRAYHQALADQYFRYGFAVDESEAEVTDDEAEDDN